MNIKRKIILNKLLYTIGNDLVLTSLLIAAYYLMRNRPDNMTLIILSILFIGAVFSFYFIRMLTVVGDTYDEGDNAFFMVVKFVFLCCNGLAALVFLAPPVIAFSLFAVNTLLVSGTQYFRVIQLLRGKYEINDGLILSAKRKIVRYGIGRGHVYTINYLVEFERDYGRSVTVCVDRFTYWRIKGHHHAALVLYKFPKGRVFGEIVRKKKH